MENRDEAAMKALVILLLLVMLFIPFCGMSCALLPPVTEKAQIRHHAEALLETCLHETPEFDHQDCFRQNDNWCLSQVTSKGERMERSCGSDGLTWGKAPIWVDHR